MNQIAVTEADRIAARVLQREREISSMADTDTCQQVAEMIIGSYPNANPSDPQTYTRALRTLLGGYPGVVVARIADPRNGIVTTCKFPPTMQEVREFADPILERMNADLRRDRTIAETMRALPAPPPESPAKRAEHVAERLGVADVSREQAMGLAEGFWPEHEQSEAYKRKAARWESHQCQSGEAIMAKLKAETEQ